MRDAPRWRRRPPPGGVAAGIRAVLPAVIALAVVLGGAARVDAWGFGGHALITELAVDALPEPLRPFFSEHREYLAQHSVDPDLWRAEDLEPEERPGLCQPGRGHPVLDGPESPRHFLDADAITPFPFRDVPRDFSAYEAQAGDRLERWGTAPWTIAAYTELLGEAMAAGDLERVRCHAAVLAHYVADFAQPFHLTENYNGQLSGLDGIHFRFESDLVEAYRLPLRSRVEASLPLAGVLKEPLEAAFRMLEEGYPAVGALLLADLRAQEEAPLEEDERGRDDPAYLRAFWERAGDVAVERTRFAAHSVASYWLTAWERAGRPSLQAGPEEGREDTAPDS